MLDLVQRCSGKLLAHPSPKFTREEWAFTRRELIGVITVLTALFALLSIDLRSTRVRRNREQCVHNLKYIGVAFRVAPTDSDLFPFQIPVAGRGTLELTNVYQHFLSISKMLDDPRLLVCPDSHKAPAGSWKSLGDDNVSYFIGLESLETFPQSWLAGDEQILVDGKVPGSNPVPVSKNTHLSFSPHAHDGVGMVCMGDGSVQQLSPERVGRAIASSEVATNLLLLPR